MSFELQEIFDDVSARLESLEERVDMCGKCIEFIGRKVEKLEKLSNNLTPVTRVVGQEYRSLNTTRTYNQPKG